MKDKAKKSETGWITLVRDVKNVFTRLLATAEASLLDCSIVIQTKTGGVRIW